MAMSSNSMRDFSEKRDFIRMKVNAEIDIKLADGGVTLRGVCRDLSGTGMLLEVSEPISVGSELSASLPSNNENFPSFDTKARVIRCEPMDNGNSLVGVEILQVNR